MGANKITTSATPNGNTDVTNKQYVDSQVATRVTSTEFTEFKNSNETAIKKAEQAGLDAQATITSTVLPTFNSYLALAGGTMSGAINMGANKITTSATPNGNTDVTNKLYVDNGLNGKVNNKTFSDFQT
jgi:hypothetical protein